jgi:hypothetical protein
MIRQAIEYVGVFRSNVNRLKMLSPQYPKLYTEMNGDDFVVSTLVEFVYNGIRFNRHHIETTNLRWGSSKEWALNRINDAVGKCKSLAVPTEFDDVLGVV